MFIPSGWVIMLPEVPSYSPLVFSFKLFELQRLDQDGDGIPSYLEDLDGMVIECNWSLNPDDTDGDGIPNFLDVDDDGDGYGTKNNKGPTLLLMVLANGLSV
jgi:hypothetical protein